MENTRDTEKVISSLKNVAPTGGISSENAKKISKDLNSLLTSVNGVCLLKQPKNFEVVFPVFMRVIFHQDPDVALPILKLCDVVLEIFRNKLPKIKKEEWWKEFEVNALVKLLDSLESRIEANDDFWVTLFTFTCNVVISESLNLSPLNKLLALSQHAFFKGKGDVKIRDKAWLCWKRIIDAFGRSPKSLVPCKTVNLLMRPLIAFSHQSESQISTWVHLIEVKGSSGPSEIVKSIIAAMCKTFYQSEVKSASRAFPSGCADVLIKILSHGHVVQHCLSDIIEIFGACVCSKPSASLIEQLAGVLVRSINDLKDDGTSYSLWKCLLEQYYNTCTESPALSMSVPCQKVFTDINFLRWIESSTIGGQEIALLMGSRDFREKVLLRSIQALTYSDEPETPTKKKTRKGSYEDVWSNYCDAYISWWLNQSPPSSPKESRNPELIQSLKNSSDYQATQFLLLQPLQLDMWNPTIFKTWSLLCEACHKQRFLHTFIKAIFDAVDEPNFLLQKAIDVADCLYKLDNDFCKQSAKLLETMSTVIGCMEFQNLSDVLSLSETVVLYQEMSLVLCKICKGANEKSVDYDQLNGHKIKTKVSKIMRKLEQLSNSAEKEKPTKAQRTPFRAQSNFLQRLAKAEEKNRTKSPFFTSLFSGAEKVEVENDEDAQMNGSAAMDTLENGVVTADSKKPVNLDDSDIMPIITLPSVLKCGSALGSGHTEGMVAEKENVILSAINGSNTAASPTVGSPKMKITNAREVKPVDPSSSPVVARKPKPVAGQKSTPKKVTPSKVSYFDDDANDCVMVPPKPKTTPLTEHQMEIMSKRRTDIPALYQDLSQDTQSQQVSAIQELTTGVSVRPIQESQDFVPGTPSPEDCVAVSTPALRKSSGKTCTSAKKLDFDNLSTPSSNMNPMNGSFDSPEHEQSKAENSVELVSGLPTAQSDESKKAEPLTNSNFSSENLLAPTHSNEVEEELKEDPKPTVDGKSKRKRKSEPAKFSPKLTRSKKHLRNATPDAKLTRLPEPESKVNLRVNPPEADAKSAEPSPSEPPNKSSLDVTGVIKTEDTKAAEEQQNRSETSSSEAQEKSELSRQLAESELPCSQNESELPEPLSQDRPMNSRKRKVVESPNNETPKKVKTSGEDGSSAGKKSDSAKKKKKKPFKLGAGGNLENWLVKTDRVSTHVPEPEVKCEKVEPVNEIATESEGAGSEILPCDTAGELDNSDEIVPSTQEGLMEKHTRVLPVLETKTDEKCENEDIVEIETDGSMVAVVPDDADNHTPEKPEGSMLERLSHESPNDDDIALVISPSKRQRRAPSVFRGEGDTCISKEKLYSTAELGEESKVLSRGKHKAASPTSKKRLQPLGGRSAKMLRLATSSTTQEDNDDIVVTPVRRRESIAPVKYGENWPKGPVEDWVACTPASPYMSPFRSALKKTPGLDENTTPQRVKNDSMASPLLSSAKRKRVMFLDPPVTRGLAYDMDSPGGSVHHADVPQGSPYPTWKGDDAKMEISPSKRDAERLNSLAELKANSMPQAGVQEEASPAEHSKRTLKPQPDLKLYAASDVSDEIRQLIDPAEPNSAVSSLEPNMTQFQEKFKLTDDFMTAFSRTDAHLQSLLLQCFDSSNMAEIVDAWKFGECRRICQMPHSFLLSIKNLSGEILTDTLASGLFTAPTNKLTEFCESSVQTEQPVLSENSSQTHAPPLKNSDSQTVTNSRTVETNTEIAVSSSSTQADIVRPSVEDWPSLLQNATPQEALLYFSDSLRVFSESLSNKK